MEKIKVGEYCRTDTGEIYIMKYFIKEFDYSKIKHSQNIIDLVEVGDYVNGHLVVDIYTDLEDFGDGCTGIEVESDLQAHKLLTKKHIKSIITKQRLASVEYKLDN